MITLAVCNAMAMLCFQRRAVYDSLFFFLVSDSISCFWDSKEATTCYVYIVQLMQQPKKFQTDAATQEVSDQCSKTDHKIPSNSVRNISACLVITRNL